jgi:dTDP-4-amino-4,6-dideoxygalactose transaminase
MTPKNIKIPLMVPKLPKKKDLNRFLSEIDKNFFYTNFGPLNQNLEGKIISWLKEKTNETYFVNTCSNATLGIQLSIQLLRLKPKSLILIPSFTFIATALAVINSGHIPVISDIDEHSFLLTPEIAENALLTKNFDAVIPVSTFGVPCDLSQWELWKEKHQIPIIIDAAAAFGTQIPSKTIPVIYSFHATKALPAGEGGAMVTKDELFAKEFKKLTNFGFGINSKSGGQKPNLLPVGTNAKLSEYHAAVALSSLDYFDGWAESRRKKLALYQTKIKKIGRGHFTFQKNSVSVFAPTFFNVICSSKKLRNIIAGLAEKNNIQTRLWYQPLLHQHPDLPNLKCLNGCIQAEKITDKIIGLPFYANLKKKEMNQVTQLLEIALKINEQT